MVSQPMDRIRRKCKAISSFPKLASNGFDVHLAAPGSFKSESCRVLFEQLVNACVQYAFALPAAIERGCSIGANCAQNCQLTSSDLKTRIAIARFRTIRARFDKRSAPAFS
jgi:hypothetical protein